MLQDMSPLKIIFGHKILAALFEALSTSQARVSTRNRSDMSVRQGSLFHTAILMIADTGNL